MNYHNIKHDDMLNGEGIRVTLFVSGCFHGCPGCHNPETHSINSGIPFDEKAVKEIFTELKKDYISGITFSGGDPLNPNNIEMIYHLCKIIRENFPEKNIWLYTGYVYEYLREKEYPILNYIDVLVDGEFIENLKDPNLKWCGSSNQRIIDVQKSLKYNIIAIYEDNKR